MSKYYTVLDMVKGLGTSKYIYLNVLFKIYTKRPVENLSHYRHTTRVYLDEYPEQKELRKRFFAKRWNLKTNQGIRKVG